MYSKEVAQNMEQIESALVEMDQIDELDSARRFIKALNLCRSSRSLIECTAPCTAHNLEACEATLAKIAKHKSARHLIPPGVTPREAARLLSVLNTNSHELSEWGGSGFFLLACLMEHSCAPNCTFNTHETALWVTVTEPVPKVRLRSQTRHSMGAGACPVSTGGGTRRVRLVRGRGGRGGSVRV
jgi:hypothetical protein